MGSFLGYEPEIAVKSPWRLDFERYLQEQAVRSRPIVKAAQIQARQVKAARVPRNSPGAGRKPRIPKTARRLGVRNKQIQHWALVERTKFCATCEKALNKNNSTGYCKKDLPSVRKIALLGERPKCSHDGCEKLLYRDNHLSLCTEHGAAIRKKEWREANKERVKILAKKWNEANNHKRRKAWKDMVKSNLPHAERS